MHFVNRYTVTVDLHRDPTMADWFDAQSNPAASLGKLVADYVDQYGLADVADSGLAKPAASDYKWDGPHPTRQFGLSLDSRRDALTDRWFDAQSNRAASLRVLIANWVEQFGVSDVWEMSQDE